MIALLAVFLALQDPSYETTVLETGPLTHHIEARDLNGDGKLDLIIQNGRDLQIFLQDKGSFGPKPQQVLRLDAGVFLWTFGMIDGQKLPSILTAGSRAIQAIPFDGAAFGAPRDLVVHPSMFEGSVADAHAPLFAEFAPDLDRDGRSEVLLFQEDEIFVMKQHAGGEFRCLQKLPVPMDVATLVPWAPHQKLTQSIGVPLLSFGDTDGNGRTDIAYYREESIGVFRQQADGGFQSGESKDLAVEKKRRRNRFVQFDVPPRVADFNGDGLLDVALIYPSKGRVHLYYGRQGRNDWTQPDQVMNVADGWSTGIYLEDLGGRGKLDLVMGVVRKFGISEGIQVFLSGKVDLELHIYPMQANGRFSKDPVQELKFPIPFSFQVTRDSASLDLVFRPNFRGDFNKDGLRDMLVRVDERTLKIYPGDKERVILDRPSGSIAMDPPAGVSTTEPFVMDLNGDGVSDLLLKHVLINPPKHVLELKLSK
ncbi:MAG: VCBS repeat-containing protein [Planctomycetaceae bacterium]|nr:VCBS repeat-containing protein [Planctomycetaceae bacterium]